MESILLKDGTQHYVGSLKNYRELIETYLGFDAARYFDELQEEIECDQRVYEYDMNELKDEIADLKTYYKKQIEVLERELKEAKKKII